MLSHVTLCAPSLKVPSITKSITSYAAAKYSELRQMIERRWYDGKIPVYYVNLESETSRRVYVESYLKDQGFQRVQRVPAWTVADVKSRVDSKITSVSNMLKPNDKEIACIASHLVAMFMAVNDTSNISPYAMILEDDIRFADFDINWYDLAAQAPKDFSILQLSTSNSELWRKLWLEYNHTVTQDFATPHTTPSSRPSVVKDPRLRVNQVVAWQGFLRGSREGGRAEKTKSLATLQWSKREWNSMLWSTHGYIISKDKIRERIHQYVKYDIQSQSFRVTLPPPPTFQCWQKPCMLPFRIVADIYLYASFPPSYISRLPLLNGVSAIPASSSAVSTSTQKLVSTIQSLEKTLVHQKEFQIIDQMIGEVHQAQARHHLMNKLFLPDYIRPQHLLS